ncbi:hypothetical protein BLOT_000360 [Blomia tropicalis]|nr:hypothetical protein BLOT_000360 [Blomia tropicalis]
MTECHISLYPYTLSVILVQFPFSGLAISPNVMEILEREPNTLPSIWVPDVSAVSCIPVIIHT